MISKFFTPKAIYGLNRIGDILIPKADEFPSFSEYGAAAHVDDILAYAPPGDVKSLNSVLTVIAYLPDRILRWLVCQMAVAYASQNPLASLLRQLNTGLRGIIFTIYYAGKAGPDFQGKDPLDIIGFKINRVDP